VDRLSRPVVSTGKNNSNQHQHEYNQPDQDYPANLLLGVRGGKSRKFIFQ
jgi:hypothetical protein